MGESHGVHVHRLDELDVLYVFGLRKRAAALRTERVAVHTLEDDLLAVDKDTVIVIAIVSVMVFDGTEAELLPFNMQGLALCVLQREDCGV